MAFYPRSDREDRGGPEDRQPRREDDDRQTEQQVRAQLSGDARLNYDLTMTRIYAAPMFEESAPLNTNCHWCRRILSEQSRLVMNPRPPLPDLPVDVFSLEERLNLIPTCVAHQERLAAHLSALEMIDIRLRVRDETSAGIAERHRYGYLGAFLSGPETDPACDAANDNLPF